MANPELKSTASDIKSTANSTLSSVNSSVRDTVRETKHMGEQLRDRIDEATPRVRETIDQFSNVASDLYGRASTWMKTGNNRDYSFIAMAAAAGLVGFFVGRSFRSSSSSEL
jgi:ElaB/YqjD/DUF883 family membrane-anchored ribosome-binding protein